MGLAMALVATYFVASVKSDPEFRFGDIDYVIHFNPYETRDPPSPIIKKIFPHLPTGTKPWTKDKDQQYARVMQWFREYGICMGYNEEVEKSNAPLRDLTHHPGHVEAQWLMSWILHGVPPSNSIQCFEGVSSEKKKPCCDRCCHMLNAFNDSFYKVLGTVEVDKENGLVTVKPIADKGDARAAFVATDEAKAYLCRIHEFPDGEIADFPDGEVLDLNKMVLD